MLFVFMIVAAGGAMFVLWTRGNRQSMVAAPLRIYVAGAAIRYSDLGAIALPLPKSHDDIRALVERLHGSRTGKHRGEIGYITDHGAFVKAREALVIARQARQLRKVPLKGDALELDYLVLPDKRSAASPRTREPPPSRPRRSGARRYRGAALWMTRTPAARQIVTREHLHRDFLRTAMVTVPCLFVAGLVSLQFGIGRLSSVVLNAPDGDAMSPLALTLPLGQCAIYALLGLGLAMVIHARGAPLRGPAVAVFSALMAVNLLWAASFNAGAATYSVLLAAAMVVLAPLTFAMFGRIRFKAAMLAVPGLVWTGLATYSTLHLYLGPP